ncbi:kinase-like domain-containing protein [Amylostereum chailletii]|nr:kinase-like domain-containing protein [Amylostereum chailletii]
MFHPPSLPPQPAFFPHNNLLNPNNLPPKLPNTKEPFVAQAIPAVHLAHNVLHYGDANSSSTRSFTPIKAVGDGSFGTVWLCDWHGELPSDTPLAAMQSGAGARPEYANKRLVAVKRMKKKWEGGWDECRRLKELEALRAIPMHENIIPLYDSFLLPETKELYFVFEPMEGHLFQLIKARKGRPLAGGLVASIFRQIVSGLDHIHLSGYFHRDMKPENVLVTTTGLHDYPNLSPNGGAVERDVMVIIKLADFGLARETKSKPPYTEYVSTRWYRAPEVLLKSREYSNPVDMWALGTIMAELVNLRPLFPGKTEYDQITKITEVLGDPSDDYGLDARGKAIGGGKWPKGIKLGKSVGFTFPKTQPRDITCMFDQHVPPKLIQCIADLLKYEPGARLTSRQCLEHPYLLETARAMPPLLPTTAPAPPLAGHRNGVHTSGSLPTGAPRAHPSQTHFLNGHTPSHLPDASASHRQSIYSTSSGPAATYAPEPAYAHVKHLHDPMHPSSHQVQHSMSSTSSYMSSVPSDPGMFPTVHGEISEEYVRQPMDVQTQTSPMATDYPMRPPLDADAMLDPTNQIVQPIPSGTVFGKLSGLRKQHKWGGLFGHSEKPTQGPLAPVDEVQDHNPTSLKRSKSSSTNDSHSAVDVPSISEPQRDPRKVKKEAERVAREAEKQRRALAEKNHREQARAVIEKRNLIQQQQGRSDIDWKWQHHAALANPHLVPEASPPPRFEPRDKGKSAHGGGPIRQISASNGFGPSAPYSWRAEERMAKARRREYDDDHSMSSSDVQSIGPMSAISFATVDSDPGPSQPPALLRNRPSLLGIRGTSSRASSSLRQFDEYSMSARSSQSHSFEQQLVHDFHLRASVDSGSISDAGSPPPMHALTLSPQHSWQTVRDRSPDVSMAQPQPSRLFIPPHLQHGPASYGGHSHPRLSSHSPNFDAPKSAINPIFKVPSLPSMKSGASLFDVSNAPALPPFSQLEAIAKGEYPQPLSPMAFTSPDDVR